MKPFLSFAPSTALAFAVSCTLGGCNLFSDPPTQLEAKLFASGTTIEDKKTLARNLVQQLNIKELKADNVRVAFDEDKKTYFFRVVGKEALPPALLKQVSAGLAKINQDNAWQGKLMVEAGPEVDAFLKTKEREFTVVAPWHTAQVDAYLLESAIDRMMAQRQMIGQEQPSLPKRVACMLSFSPKDALPELKGKLSEVMPGAGGSSLAMMQSTGLLAREMTVPHKVSFAHPELAKLTEPVVEDRKVMFQFALIEDAKVTVIGSGIEGRDPVTIDHGTVGLCQTKLREVAPATQALIDRSKLLADVAAIGPAQLVALPKPQ